MLFSSLTFIYGFLPLILFSYFIIKNRVYRNIVLLIFSLIFYAWGEPKYSILMLGTIAFAYTMGILINHFDAKKKLKLKNLFFMLSILIIIGSLVFFKYTNFIFSNINNIFNLNIKAINIVLPIGISFYTFQILSYIIDLYRGKIKVQKNFISLALYVTLFPQLIAGPIVRYQTIEEELSKRKESFDDFVKGLKRFILGLSKKIIIANNVAIIADFVFDQGIIYKNYAGSLLIWIGAIAYTLQIYYDFSGYSDMAIGLGRMFGFHFLENFDYPYISKSITDFWRRWHISLSSWFRDYVYIPLGGNRVSKIHWIFNIMLVWMLTGLWHGAAWNFILWGLYFGVILILEKEFLSKIISKLPNCIKWLYSIVLIIIGWVIFRANTIESIGFFLRKMFDFSKTNFLELIAINNITLSFIFLIIGIVFSFPIRKQIGQKLQKHAILTNVIYLSLFIICIVFLVSSSYNPFIYFRF